MLSGSFGDPQGEQENGEVFRRVDTYVCASIHFSSTLRNNSDFFNINVTATRVGWLLNGMCSSKKYPYPPPPGISIQGVLVITCPPPRTLIILFMS